MTVLKFEHLTQGTEIPEIEDGYGGLIWVGFTAADVTAPKTPASLVALQREAHGSGIAAAQGDQTVTFSAPDGYVMKGLSFWVAADIQPDEMGVVAYENVKEGRDGLQFVYGNEPHHFEPYISRNQILSVSFFFHEGTHFGIDDLRFKLVPIKSHGPSVSSNENDHADALGLSHDHLHLAAIHGSHAPFVPLDGLAALA